VKNLLTDIRIALGGRTSELLSKLARNDDKSFALSTYISVSAKAAPAVEGQSCFNTLFLDFTQAIKKFCKRGSEHHPADHFWKPKSKSQTL
jgi:hypothetical protein